MNEIDESNQIYPKRKIVPFWKYMAILLVVIVLTFVGFILGMKYKTTASQGVSSVSHLESQPIQNSSSPVLQESKKFQDKDIGVFSLDGLVPDKYVLSRNYVIALIKDGKPLINVTPGYITTSLAETIYSCVECFDVVAEKIYVVNGETNSISSYKGEFYDDGRNYFTHVSTYLFPFDPVKAGNLFSILCKENMCIVKSGYKSLIENSYDFNPITGSFNPINEEFVN